MSAPASSPNPAADASDPRLVAALRAEIAAAGPLTFARFMDQALLHPAFGYYATRPAIGRGGDFVTSPELHPAFGGCLMRQAAEVWRGLGAPNPFTVLEWGAGTGALARDLLTAAAAEDPPFAAALDYAIHEVSPALVAAQQATLGAAGQAARWTAAAAPAVGLVLANEVLDALPVHRLTLRDDRLLEFFVDWQTDGFVEVAGLPSTPALAEALAAGGVQLVEGQVAEVSLAALTWLDRVAAELGRGAVVIIDYGDETADLYGPRRRRGTLLCYWRQTVNEDPFQRVGRQDMTAHVDFGALMRRAPAVGLAVQGRTTQGAFLAGLGLEAVLLDLQTRLPAAEYVRQRQAVADLIRPDRLGRFQVLLLGRDLPPGLALSGLRVRL
ncbi:MAG: SAM-dependent methyltransferase [Chloroflexi bacterium]|nr:SAM-dependent methyltransferase [Chloroflexota bacterium]